MVVMAVAAAAASDGPGAPLAGAADLVTAPAAKKVDGLDVLEAEASRRLHQHLLLLVVRSVAVSAPSASSAPSAGAAEKRLQLLLRYREVLLVASVGRAVTEVSVLCPGDNGRTGGRRAKRG